MIPGGSFGAWWEADHGETDYVKGHVWGVTLKANLTDNLIAYGGYSDYNGDNVRADAALNIYDPADQRNWTAGVQWNVATGLYIRAEYAKTITSNSYVTPTVANPTGLVDGNSTGGFAFRIHRSF